MGSLTCGVLADAVLPDLLGCAWIYTTGLIGIAFGTFGVKGDDDELKRDVGGPKGDIGDGVLRRDVDELKTQIGALDTRLTSLLTVGIFQTILTQTESVPSALVRRWVSFRCMSYYKGALRALWADERSVVVRESSRERTVTETHSHRQ
jgi:hypothetical protein